MDKSQPNKNTLAHDADFHPMYGIPPRYADDEISLVDLAKILIRRKVTLFVTFLVVFMITVLFAWNKHQAVKVDVTDKVAYQTLLAVGYKSPTMFIEPMESIKTQLEVAFIPETIRILAFSSGETLVEITERKNIRVEEGSNLVKLITVLNSDASVGQEEIKSMHQRILSPLIQRHNKIVDQINTQFDSGRGEFVYQPVATDIAVLAAPAPAPAPKSKLSPTLILALGIVLGGIMSVMAAFMKEFAFRVKESLEADKA